MKITSRWFKEAEFKQCNPPCSLQDMNQETMSKADKARDIAGIPMVVNCAHRSPAWDKERGRSGTGSHTKGRGLDFRCNSERNRFVLVAALLKAGFTRIGIAKTYIHADDSPTHTQEIIWLY
jgi:hypothetical protein